MTEQRSTANKPTNTYTITPHPDASGYDVQVAGYDGARQTMMGFKTQADAEAWIAADQARDRAEGKPG